MFAPVESQDGGLSFRHRRHADRTLPQPGERTERLLRIIRTQVDALVLVAQEQLAPVLEVGVLHVDEGIARIGELEQELVFDLAKLARIDLVPLVAVRPAEAEELVLAAEFGREKLVDERDVAVEGAHLEDLAPPEAEPKIPVLLRLERIALLPLTPELPLVPPLLDVPEELDPELVGIEPPARGGENAGVVVGVVDDLG